MNNQKIPEDFTAKYEQIRLRSKQRLIGGIVILMFALFLLLYVVAKIKPLSSHTTIIMKTKASDVEQLGIKQIVNTKQDTSSAMIQVVDNSSSSANDNSSDNTASATDASGATSSGSKLASVVASDAETSANKSKEDSSVAVANKADFEAEKRKYEKKERAPSSIKTRKKSKNKSKESSRSLDPEAILNGHA